MLTAATIACNSTTNLPTDQNEERAKEVIAKTQERQEDIMSQQLAMPYPGSGFGREIDFAFGAYHFNQRTNEADEGLILVKNSYMKSIIKI